MGTAIANDIDLFCTYDLGMIKLAALQNIVAVNSDKLNELFSSEPAMFLSPK